MKKIYSVESHFDNIAKDYDFYKKKNKYYYDNLKLLLKKLIPEGKRVLEVGCGTGDLLASLNPSYGYGNDISSKMIKIAKEKYGSSNNLLFSTSWPNDNFDYIFMSDVIEHLENPEDVFGEVSKLMSANTVFVNTMANPIWEPVLMIVEKLKLKMPEGKHNRISFKKIEKIATEVGLEIINHDYELLLPIKIRVIADFVNRHFLKYFKKLAFIEYFVAVKK